MRSRAIVIVVALTVALAGVVLAAGTRPVSGKQPAPTPTPTATPPALRTYTVSATAVSPAEPIAYCDVGDALTGGGIQNPNATQLVESYPVFDSTSQRSGWTGGVWSAPATITAYAVCLDNPPYHTP